MTKKSTKRQPLSKLPMAKHYNRRNSRIAKSSTALARGAVQDSWTPLFLLDVEVRHTWCSTSPSCWEAPWQAAEMALRGCSGACRTSNLQRPAGAHVSLQYPALHMWLKMGFSMFALHNILIHLAIWSIASHAHTIFFYFTIQDMIKVDGLWYQWFLKVNLCTNWCPNL